MTSDEVARSRLGDPVPAAAFGLRGCHDAPRGCPAYREVVPQCRGRRDALKREEIPK